MDTRWTAQDVGKGLGLVVGLAVLMVTGVLLVRQLYPGQLMPLMLALTALLELGMLAPVWLFGVRKAGSWKAVGLRLTSSPYAYSLLPLAVLIASLLASTLYLLAVSRAGIEVLRPVPPAGLLQLEGAQRLAGAAIVVGAGPFAEELFWRGFVLPGLVARLGVVGATGVSSLLFALAHMTPGVLIPAFISGVLLSWLYLRTRSVVPGLLAHSAQNALAFIAMG